MFKMTHRILLRTKFAFAYVSLVLLVKYTIACSNSGLYANNELKNKLFNYYSTKERILKNVFNEQRYLNKASF